MCKESQQPLHSLKNLQPCWSPGEHGLLSHGSIFSTESLGRCGAEMSSRKTQHRQGRQSTYALTHPTLRALFIWGINSEDKHEGKLQRSSPSRIQGNPQDERHWWEKTRRTGHDGAKSARERERETERETRLGYAAESGSCFIFHHHLYTLCWFISKGQISIQT